MASEGSGNPPDTLRRVHWRKVEQLFQELVDLADAEPRLRLLEAVEAESPELRQELESLLAVHQQSTAALRGALLAAPAPPGSDTGWVGRQLGVYRVISELDRGGMSRVYLARRNDLEFEKQVVIKTIEPELLSPALVQRFLQERQILASLEHPGIASLLDGNTTEEGVPYLVMEHVDGQPIDRFCDEQRLSIQARLKIFLGVCEAVEEAHRRLIIHRDLKPGNILVDTQGRPKLLDFGIAKILEPNPGADLGSVGNVAATHAHQRPMTPRYASPEQVEGLQLSTATDVFSLGIVLYELVVGAYPFERQNRLRAEASSRWQPTRPSQALRRTDAEQTPTSVAEVARRRGCSPRALLRQLGGDLEAILFKAVQAEPSTRYASVAELSEDLRSVLEHRPVRARRITAAYRFGKLLRRNPISSSVVATAAVVLVIAGVALARAERRASRERDAAEQALGFLTGVFRASDPFRAGNSPVTLRELLDAGSQKIDADLAENPEVQARMLDVLGDVYGRIGETAKSVELLERAVALNRQVTGAKSAATAKSLHFLGGELLRGGRYAEGEAALAESLAIRQRLFGAHSEQALSSLSDLADVWYHQDRLEEAERASRDVLDFARSDPSTAKTEIAENLTTFGHILRRSGKMNEAEAAFRERLEIYRQALGDRSPQAARAMSDLAHVIADMGDREGARVLLLDAIGIWKQRYPEGHVQTARLLVNVAVGYLHERRYAEAEARLLESAAIHEKLLEPNHPELSHVLESLGVAQLLNGALAKAESTLERCIAIRREALGEEHPRFAVALSRLADARRLQGDLVGAAQNFERAMALLRAKDRPYELTTTLTGLGKTRYQQGRYAEAEALFREKLEYYRAKEPHVTDRIAEAQIGLALSRIAQHGLGDTEAQQLLREAQKVVIGFAISGDERLAVIDAMQAVQGKTDAPRAAERRRQALARWEASIF